MTSNLVKRLNILVHLELFSFIYRMEKYNLPCINQPIETVVLGNGLFPNSPLSLYILDHCKHLITCDGATNKLVRSGRTPHAIVGDCDSLDDDILNTYQTIIHRISEQESNDQTKAVNYCISKGWINIAILGATGEREDHTIGNISLLCDYIKDARVQIITDHGVFVAIDKTSIFESWKGQQVSLFSIDSKPISTSGLVYEINDSVFNRWWQATLNEANGDHFTVKTSSFVIVFRAFEIKNKKDCSF